MNAIFGKLKKVKLHDAAVAIGGGGGGGLGRILSKSLRVL